MGVRLKVREYAEQRGINQAQLARRANLGTTTVYELWRNIRSENVRIGTLITLGEVLNVPWCDLVEETKDETHSLGDEGIQAQRTPVLRPTW